MYAHTYKLGGPKEMKKRLIFGKQYGKIRPKKYYLLKRIEPKNGRYQA